jgi:hypothetical protein
VGNDKHNGGGGANSRNGGLGRDSVRACELEARRHSTVGRVEDRTRAWDAENRLDEVDTAMATPVRSDERSSGRLPLKLELRPVIDLQDDQFYEFCRIDRDVRIERNVEGELLSCQARAIVETALRIAADICI